MERLGEGLARSFIRAGAVGSCEIRGIHVQVDRCLCYVVRLCYLHLPCSADASITRPLHPSPLVATDQCRT
jgi:hypothetical protein